MEHGRFSLELRGPPKGNHLRLKGYANMSDLKSQGNALVKGMLNSQYYKSEREREEKKNAVAERPRLQTRNQLQLVNNVSSNGNRKTEILLHIFSTEHTLEVCCGYFLGLPSGKCCRLGSKCR